MIHLLNGLLPNNSSMMALENQDLIFQREEGPGDLDSKQRAAAITKSYLFTCGEIR